MSEKNNAPAPETPEIEPISDDALDGVAGGGEFCSVIGCSSGNQN